MVTSAEKLEELRLFFNDYFQDTNPSECQSYSQVQFNRQVSSSSSIGSISDCTIPMATPSQRSDSGLLSCRWDRCGFEAHSQTEFYDHVNEKHVNSQRRGATTSGSPRKRSAKFRCRWKQCRMFDSEIPSFERLEKHIRNSHTKEKQFRCRMQSCHFETNFSQELLKHMDVHDKAPKDQIKSNYDMKFTSKDSPFVGNSRKNSSCSTPRPHFDHISKKKGVKYPPTRSQSVSEPVKTSLQCDENLNTARFALKLKNTMNKVTSFIDFDPNESLASVGLRGKVIGKRSVLVLGSDLSHVQVEQVLVRWFPLGICCDEWLEASSLNSWTKRVPIRQVPKQFWTKTAAVLLNKPNCKQTNSRRKADPRKLML